MAENWQQFWNNYRNIEAQSEDDLYVQVGKTINKEPIPRAIFREMILRIAERLELSPSDHLMDFCCGNGLITHELAPGVREVTAIDFAEHLIRAAKKFKQLPNVSYHVGDITKPLSDVVPAEVVPDKFLMNDSLGYFNPATLELLLGNIVQHVKSRSFLFLLTGIPNVDLKWNFYNTPERRARHLENETLPDNTNDGLGRWWSTEEIRQICSRLGLLIKAENQPDHISNYRMNVTISPGI